MIQPFSPLPPEPVLSGAYTWRSLIHHIRLMSLPITKKYMPENKGVPLHGDNEDRLFPGRALRLLLTRYSFLGSISWERRSHLLTSNERHLPVLSHLIPSSVKLCGNGFYYPILQIEKLRLRGWRNLSEKHIWCCQVQAPWFLTCMLGMRVFPHRKDLSVSLPFSLLWSLSIIDILISSYCFVKSIWVQPLNSP